jgi:hypothetical protein
MVSQGLKPQTKLILPNAKQALLFFLAVKVTQYLFKVEKRGLATDFNL